MALQLQPTLGDMVSEVLQGMNLGVQGEENADLHPLIRRCLRDAQAFLWAKNPWLQNRTVALIALVAGEADYELPDSFRPGSLRRVYARSNRSVNIEWDLSGGVDPEHRTGDRTQSLADGTPYRYELIEKILRIHPAIVAGDDNPPTLHLEMDLGASPLENDDSDRPAVDGRACIMLGTILAKENRRLPVGDTERAILTEYIQSQRGKQRESRVFTLGTDWRHPSEYPIDRRRPYNRDNWIPTPNP